MHIWIPRWSSWSLHDFFEIVNQKDDVKAIHRLMRGAIVLPLLFTTCIGANPPDIDGRVWKWIRQQTASRCLEDTETLSGNLHLPDEVFKEAEIGDHDALKASLERRFRTSDLLNRTHLKNCLDLRKCMH